MNGRCYVPMSNDLAQCEDCHRHGTRNFGAMRTIKISVSCPHCIEAHSIPANEMYFEGLSSWPAGALSRFETALNLASSDAAKS